MGCERATKIGSKEAAAADRLADVEGNHQAGLRWDWIRTPVEELNSVLNGISVANMAI